MKEMPVYFEVTDMRKSSWTSRKQQQKMLESIKKSYADMLKKKSEDMPV